MRIAYYMSVIFIISLVYIFSILLVLVESHACCIVFLQVWVFNGFKHISFGTLFWMRNVWA